MPQLVNQPPKNFVELLQAEAKFQQQLNRSKILPSSLGPLATLVATHAWQSLIVLSLTIAIIFTYLGLEIHIL